MGAVHLYGKRATEASSGERFTPADLRLVAIMAQQTMVGLENASLYEGMRGIFMSATLALANAVDAKDPYTRGHSERVLNYSEQLARAMNLPPQDVESIKMAAVLHDIGKIAIPDEILRKPGRLTAGGTRRWSALTRRAARPSWRRSKNSGRCGRASATITNGSMARATRIGSPATPSRCTRASSAWRTPSTR